VRRGRKAAGLKQTAGLPGLFKKPGFPAQQGGLAFAFVVDCSLNKETNNTCGAENGTYEFIDLRYHCRSCICDL
jgi:hypothetical protein